MGSSSVAPIDAYADEAVRWVCDELSQNDPDIIALRGAKGRLQTEQDLRCHLEFLSSSLRINAPIFFVDYIRWQTCLLESRGVPRRVLDVSLKSLTEFFLDHVEPPVSESIADALEQGRQALAGFDPVHHHLYQAHRPRDLPHVPRLTQSLIAGDVHAARDITQTAWQASGNYAELATRLFQPALYDIGDLWQRNEITVAQEHLATAIAESLLTRLYMSVARFTKPPQRTVVFAGVEGNQHVLGLHIVADVFELAGWVVQYLGANTPTDSLLSHVDQVRPDVVGLSASMVQQLPSLQRAVQDLRSEFGSNRPVIVVGGLPTNQHDETWRWIGADAWSPDAQKAVLEMT